MATRERGQAVVLAYMAVFVITMLGGSLLTSTMHQHRESQLQQSQANILYLAEGGLEDGLSRFANAIANFQVDANVPRYPVVDTDFLTTTFANGATVTSEILEAEPVPRAITDPDGVTQFVKNYHIISTIQNPVTGAPLRLHQVVGRRIIYTFQHAIFYDQDLEWLPGPDMTLSGRVHSNNDLYLGTHSTLTVDNEYLRAAGQLYNRRKDSSDDMLGIVQIKKLGTSPAQFIAMAGLDSDAPTWVVESQTRWNGTVKTAAHGVTKRAVPVVGSTSPGGFYDTNADVKVVNGTLTKGGAVLTNGVNMPPNTITTTTTFYNNREGKTVRMTEIDLRKLAGWHDCNGDTVEEQCYPNNLPANGLLYATRNDAPANQQPGIRLKRGSLISRPAGLTVVSNDPVYVQGDYNTSSKKPAAIIGDALNMLSNSWNDANSTSGLASRIANNTTVNSAFIAGIETTTSGNYNGGLENYPRFHENWSGRTMSITGSFVSLWNSQIAQGDWQYGSPYYTAPNRSWHYDTSFSSGVNMPPFTPFAVEIAKGAWWVE
jgi:hypothetical protein